MGNQSSNELLNGTADADILEAQRKKQQALLSLASHGGSASSVGSQGDSTPPANATRPLIGGRAPAAPTSGAAQERKLDPREARLRAAATKPLPSAIASASPSSLAVPAPAPVPAAGPPVASLGLAANVAQESGPRHRRTLNTADVDTIRRKMDEYTNSLDFLKQMELVTGVEGKKQEQLDASLSDDSDEEGASARGSVVSSASSAAPQSGGAQRTPPSMALAASARPSASPAAGTGEDEDEEEDEEVKGTPLITQAQLEATKHLEASGATAGGAGGVPKRISIDRRSSRRGGVIAFESENELKRKSSRDMVIQEIQASEQLYYRFLLVLINSFIKPLRERRIVTEAQLKTMFSNIEQIAPYHKQLAEELVQNDDDVAQVFNQYANYLRVYTPYVNSYDAACEMIASLKTNQRFQEFLAEKRKDKECNGLDLMSYLIMPIQRIPRYRLLLEQLKKYTRETDEDYAVLEDALAKIQVLCNYVNESKRLAENRSKIVEIQHMVKGEFDNLLQPHRQLIREGPIFRKKKSSKPAHVFLFNDLLMVTDPAPEYHIQTVLNLATASVSDFPHKRKFGFVVSSPALEGESLVLVCKSKLQKLQWQQAVSEAVEAAKRAFTMARDRSMSRRSRQPSHMQRAAGSIAAQAPSGGALELGVPLPTDADFASRTSEAEREQQREDSIAAATERLKNLGMHRLNDASVQPRQH